MSRQRMATYEKANEVIYNLARHVAPESARSVNTFRRLLRNARRARTVVDSAFIGSSIATGVTHGFDPSFRDAAGAMAVSGVIAIAVHGLVRDRKVRFERAEHGMVQAVKDSYFGNRHVEISKE